MTKTLNPSAAPVMRTSYVRRRLETLTICLFPVHSCFHVSISVNHYLVSSLVNQHENGVYILLSSYGKDKSQVDVMLIVQLYKVMAKHKPDWECKCRCPCNYMIKSSPSSGFSSLLSFHFYLGSKITDKGQEVLQEYISNLRRFSGETTLALFSSFRFACFEI